LSNRWAQYHHFLKDTHCEVRDLVTYDISFLLELGKTLQRYQSDYRMRDIV